MGLFTGSHSAARKSTSAAPLKRRSLGRSRESLYKTVGAKVDHTQVEGPTISSPDRVSTESFHKRSQLDTLQPDPAQPATSKEPNPDDETAPDPELADLQSDHTLIYDRQGSIDSALGVHALHPPQPSLLESIDSYVAEHHLDCFGITHFNELIRHHNRLVPFFAKAPRFLSIHSLKRKELDRDYTEVADTVDTCPREQLCLGRCLLGFSCPTQDLTSNTFGTST